MEDRKESDDVQSLESLNLGLEKFVNFFNTAWGYEEGYIEQLLGQLIKNYPVNKHYKASKMATKNFKWSAKSHYKFEESYRAEHIRTYMERTLWNIDQE